MPLSLKLFTRTAAGISFSGEFVLDGELVTVGRSKRCTLSLEDREKHLSRVHAEFAWTGQGYLLRAASSSSSIVLNGKEHPPGSEVMVHVGDTLTLDIYELEIVDTGYAGPDPEATVAVFAPPRRPAPASVAPEMRTPSGGTGGAVQVAGLQPGHLLAGRFRVGVRIAARGIGMAYRAHDELRKEDIALKVMPPGLLGSDEARQRFMQEAKVAIRLAHQGIIGTFDLQADGAHLFLTTELLTGQTLRAAIEERNRSGKRWGEAEALAIIRPLCEALAYAHEFTVHGDIKPENVWLGEDGSVKLMDFGLARGLAGSSRGTLPVEFGPAQYRAPEQVTGGREADQRADQYALAAMLYEMLAGSIPAGRVAALGTVRSDLNDCVCEAVDKALTSVPEGRFATDGAFLAALTTPAQPAPLPAVANVSIAAGAVRSKRIGIGAAVAIAALLLVFFAWPAIQGLLPDRGVDKAAEQEIARLEAETRALLKLVEADRRELKESVAGANRDIERIKGQISAARTNQEREGLESSLLDALQSAKLNTSLEGLLRDSAESPGGIPKAEGNLSAAAVAAKGGDKANAVKLLKETSVALTRIRTDFAEARKTMVADYQRRREEAKMAESRARAAGDARAKADADAEAKARAKAKAESMARAKNEADANARADAEARARSEARAEAEAKSRAESEARARAEADARMRAEAESRKAEAEAKKAELDARRRAEADARARADAAAQARAQAEARARANEEARAKRAEERENAEQVFRIIRGFAR